MRDGFQPRMGDNEMRINVIAVGKLKEKYFADAVDEYVKRCSRFAEVRLAELPDAPQGKTPEEQKRIESAQLAGKAKGFVVVTDGRGEQISSVQLAELLKDKAGDGTKEISFLIGGSHGHTDGLLRDADKVISFGNITLPHQLFRVVLCEQIYRALSINAGTPYHK